MKTIKRSQEEWLTLVRSWEESGLSQRAFCQKHELKLATFGYWRTRYLRSQEPSEVFVRLTPETEERWVKLRWSGVEVEVCADVDIVAALLDQLSARC
jgi:hypothetical protein